MNEINEPEVVAQVTSVFEAYEAALIANDVAALQAFFWDSPHATRFGVTEELYGYEAIAQFRASRVVTFTRRESRKVTVTTFSKDFASVMYEYTSDLGGGESHGRQTQTWIRMDGAWKIAHAHVSLSDGSNALKDLLKSSLKAQGLAPEPGWQARITGNFATTAMLVAPLMDFELPATIEPAPTFKP